MKYFFSKVILTSIITICLLFNQQIAAQDKDLIINQVKNMSLEEMLNTEVVTVSRFSQKLSETPAFITILTEDQILKSGDRNLLDILKKVPGFSHSINQFGLNEIEVRGFQSTNSSTIKFLINGESVNNNVFGEGTRIFDDLSVNNIKRIEIIRGPASAIYGTNAMLAVINIITKTSAFDEMLEVGMSAGSFNTYEPYVIFGTKIANDFRVTGRVSFFKTDGPSLAINQDRFSGELYSLAPRETDYQSTKYELELNVKYKNWKLTNLYIDKSRAPFIGPSFALVEKGKFENQGRYFKTKLEREIELSPRLKLRPNFSYKKMYFSPDGQFFPSGFGNFNDQGQPIDINDDGLLDVFPDGMIAKYELNDNVLKSEIFGDYLLKKSHNISFGISYEHQWLSHLDTKSNFNIIIPGKNYYLGEFKHFNESIVDDYKRDVFSMYAQDSWNVKKGIFITAGLRMDFSSDYGSVLSPRFGITHRLNDVFNYKLLYGRGYRAPSFGELARTNNVNIVGNPDLEPETSNTYEGGFEVKLRKNALLSINFFSIKMSNQIVRVSRDLVEPGEAALIYQNENKVKSKGVEANLNMFIGSKVNFNANYTFQNARIYDAQENSSQSPKIPKHKANADLNYNFLKNINVNIAANYIGERKRELNDLRESLDRYILLNTSIEAKNIYKNWSVYLSIYNLTDKDYFDSGHPILTPGDYPRPGANFVLKLRYSIKK